MKPLRTIHVLGVSALAFTTGFSTARAAATSAASASGAACWTSQSEQTLATCPNTGPKTFNVGERGKQPHVNFKSAPQVETKKRDDKVKPGGPTEQMSAGQRDARSQRLKPRVRALLVSEIQGLENLFATTPRNAPDRPMLARRLAEAYVELESAAFRDKTEAEIRKNAAEAEKAVKIMAMARAKAISYYTLIKNSFPSYPKLDEVLYYLAYEYEQAQDLKNARAVYYELIQKAPNSKYIPSAYLAFGELFFVEAQGDQSKFELAKQAYMEVVKYPPPENKMFGYAHYKLAYVAWNQGDFPRAMTHFKRTIEFGDQYATLPNSAQLAKAARRDIVPVYALAGKPEAAYGFFKTLSGDKGGENEKTYLMMDELGVNYLDTGHYPEAVALYTDLMKRDRGDKYCQYHAHIAEATLAMKSGAKDSIKQVIDNQLAVYKEFRKSGSGAESKLKCSNVTAGLLTETAMAWHLEAVGSGGVRGTGDPKTMKFAADIYKLVVDNFAADEFAKFEFPRIVKEDWPTIYKVKYAMADLLYFQKKWDECGPAFDSVVQENPTGPEAAEAAFASVLCYQNIYEEKHKGGADRKGGGNLPGSARREDTKKKGNEADKYRPRELDEKQKGMITAFNRYICYIKPAENDKEGKDQHVEVKYARARTYFEAQHWEEAGVAFRDVALNHADHEAGIFAAQLYLESINVLGSKSEPPRPSCFDRMSEDVPKLIGLYCQGAKAKTNEEQCTSLQKIQCDIHRLKAENLVKLADAGGPTSLRTYEEAGNAYITLWRTYGEEPIRNKQPMQCERMDEVVYNAAKAFQAGRLIAKAIQARQILLNPDNQLASSELSKKAIYEIGGNYQAIAVYEKAAEWYEKYARENPKGDKADMALSDAVVLRLGLGQEQNAIDNAELFQKNFGARAPAQTAQISFAIAAHYVEQKDWDLARRRLMSAMPMIDKNATYDVRVQAHAMLGRVHVNSKGKGQAAGEYKKVRDLWSDSKSAVNKINSIPDEDDNAKLRRLAKALTAVGEAYFYFAEEQREKTVDKIPFPEYKESGYKGSGRKLEEMAQEEFQAEMDKRKKESENVKKHIDTKVKGWVEKKKGSIEGAEAEYSKILKLEPIPPPRWVIAAGSRVGTMWGGFVGDFRRAPIPGWMKKDDELRGVYYQNLDASSEPIKQRAKGAFETCLKLSVKHQYFDEFSRVCEEWLAKNYKAEYHLVDEFRGAPNLVGSGLNERPYPLQIGGQPHIELPPVAPVADTSSKSSSSSDESSGDGAKGVKGGKKCGGAKAAAGRGGRKGKK